jgi:hypothetical protein
MVMATTERLVALPPGTLAPVMEDWAVIQGPFEKML